MTDAPALTIGQAARLAGLTAKALRHYDRIGLLHPAAVDAVTGYRRYRAQQVAQARLARRLRDLELPLDEIRRLLDLAATDQPALAAALDAHRRRIEARVTRLRGVLHTLDHAITDDDWITMTEPETPPVGDEQELHRYFGRTLFNRTWTLMEKEDRTPDEDALMIHQAHASLWHWLQGGKPENSARGEWQVSRVYCVLRRPEPALYHARRVLDICQRYRRRRLGSGVRLRGARAGARDGRRRRGDPALARPGAAGRRGHRRSRRPRAPAGRPRDGAGGAAALAAR